MFGVRYIGQLTAIDSCAYGLYCDMGETGCFLWLGVCVGGGGVCRGTISRCMASLGCGGRVSGHVAKTEPGEVGGVGAGWGGGGVSAGRGGH